jgi:hypothetical protein
VISILVKAIKAELIHCKQEEQTETCNAYRQPEDVDSSKSLLFQKVSDGYLEILFDHRWFLSRL